MRRARQQQSPKLKSIPELRSYLNKILFTEICLPGPSAVIRIIYNTVVLMYGLMKNFPICFLQEI